MTDIPLKHLRPLAACRLRPSVAPILRVLCLSLLLGSLLMLARPALAQSGYTIYGDLKVSEGNVQGRLPMSFHIVLYNLSGLVIGRQTIAAGGRYRFFGLRSGEYDIAIEVENNEVARLRVLVGGSLQSEVRQDLELEWRAPLVGKVAKPQTVSAADLYQRTSANQSLYNKAGEALNKKKYKEAEALLRQLVAADPQDFHAWTELGTVHFLQGQLGDAETAYRRALSLKPTFALALLNLGRALVGQKKYEDAVAPLEKVVEVRRDSADANFLLGESYLQIKKGSKAVPYLEEAARLGRVDAHLRLAALYQAAGLKDRAAAEYEQFLKKEPNYPERKKMEERIKQLKGN